MLALIFLLLLEILIDLPFGVSDFSFANINHLIVNTVVRLRKYYLGTALAGQWVGLPYFHCRGPRFNPLSGK